LSSHAGDVVAAMAIAAIGGRIFGGLNREVHTNMDTELEGFLNSLGEAERAGGRVLHELTDQAQSLEGSMRHLTTAWFRARLGAWRSNITARQSRRSSAN
jgi:hypothetical protein